jgi:hypothetical protein
MGGVGPTIGIHDSKVFYGFELGGGIELAQGTFGYQTVEERAFVRLDLGADFLGESRNQGVLPVGRLGVGASFADTGAGGTFAIGGGPAVPLHVCGRSNEGVRAGIAGWLEMRYVGGWQVAFTPRVEVHQCWHISTH